MKRIYLLIAVGVCLAATAHAGEVMVIRFDTTEPVTERWTAEDFAGARSLPPVVMKKAEAGVDLPLPRVEEAVVEETFPSATVEPTLTGERRFALRRVLYDERLYEALREESPAPKGPSRLDLPLKNHGTDDLHYTSSRLIPSSANTTFPYSPIGKLYYDEMGVTYYCTATVVARRLVATNGDCLHREPFGWHTDMVFVPAEYRGDAPFGVWDVSIAGVWVDYYYQNETAGPWGIVEIIDQGGYTVSDYTGKLANVSRKMAPNELHMLGYDDDLDGGQELHQVTSGHSADAFGILIAYGSDMFAPGAPWIQNFNRKAQGQGGGSNKARAAVVGFQTFWWWGSWAPRSAIGREVTANFKRLRQEACGWSPGNC